MLGPSALWVAIWLLGTLTGVACSPKDEAVQLGIVTVGDGAGARALTDSDGPADVPLDATDPDIGTKPKTDVPGLPEKCANFTDDDGDGLIDEGCYLGPSVRPDQQWHDLGLYAVADGVFAGPIAKVGVVAGRRTLVLARDVTAPALWVAADLLRAPNGTVWLGAQPWPASPGRGAPGDGVGSLLIGGSDAIEPIAGDWSTGFRRTHQITPAGPGISRQGRLHIGVLSASAGGAQRVIDADVYVMDGQPMMAAALQKSALLARIIKRVAQIWQPAGLTLGTLTFIDVGGDDGKRFRHVDNVLDRDASNELPGLFALAATLRPNSTAMSLFLVASINASDQPVAAGLTGQLAGVNGLAGHRANAIVLALPADDVNESLKADPTAKTAGDAYGAILAHELGHHLGLWHTTERTATLQDTVADTASCPLKEGQSFVAADGCASGNNLMFWSPQDVALSKGQVTVVRRHPTPR